MNLTFFIRGLLLSVGLVCSATATAVSTGAPIFVLNSLDANVSVIDPVSYKEIRRVPTGKEPHHIYMTPDKKSLMVANALSDTITLIDPRTGEIQRTIKDIVDPYQLQFSPDMKWLVTAANRLDHIDIYAWKPLAQGFDLTLVKRISAGKTPSHIMINAKSTRAYVTLQDSDQLIAIDLTTQTPLWTVAVGKTPADVFLTPDQKTLLVALTGDSYVEAYDVSAGPAKLIKRIKTGEGAHAFRAQGDQRHVLVSNRTSNSVSRIDMQTLTVLETIPVPGGPDCMDLLADGKTLLVTSRWARKLSVVDLEQKKVIKQVPVGKSPHGVWNLNHAPTR